MEIVAPSSAAVQLYDYQRTAVEDLRGAIRALRRESRDPRVLLVAPTGAGKGTIASWMIAAACAKGSRILFLVNRRTLVQDLSRRLYRLGVAHGVIMASNPSKPWLPVQVASIDTLQRRPHVPPADLIFVDEAHFSLSNIWLSVIAKYPGVPVIGMTATPCRADGRGLGDLFNEMVECPGTAELTERGHLAPARIFAPSQPDLSGVQVQAGEYNQKQLASAVDKGQLIGDIVEHWARLAKGRPSVVFAVNVEHSRHIVSQFEAVGISAQHVDANTPDADRDRLWADLETGRVQICSSVGVISYGWDVPCVSCGILARPTKSLALYLQQCGRVLRTHASKEFAIILDHAGSVLEHGFPDDERSWTLDGARKRKKPERDPALSVRMCLQCWCAFRSTQTQCPACGWQYISQKAEIKTAAGELQELTESPKPQPYRIKKLSDNPAFAYFQQQAEAREKSHRWAWMQYQLFTEGKIGAPDSIFAAWQQYERGRRGAA
jgi:DNA repair protein RadD